MRYTLMVILVSLFFSAGLQAQTGSQQRLPEKKGIRIADTLTSAEKNTGNRVILKSELDSLIRVYNASLVKIPVVEPVKEQKNEMSLPVLFLLLAGAALIVVLLYALFRVQKRSHKIIHELNRHVRGKEFSEMQSAGNSVKNKAANNLEKKIGDMHGELEKLQQRNQQLEQPAREFKLVKQEYESMKQQIAEVYKMKNYPGYDPAKPGTEMLKGLFDTERSVASYAYEKFLKPILAIADANKNNPARIDKEESEKLLQLLVSLSLLYIEYLYLRIGDLSIGGGMVKRIQGLKNGNGLDPALMKKLNTEHGSRALVLRMVLDAMQIRKLTYPVFDETNLNLS